MMQLPLARIGANTRANQDLLARMGAKIDDIGKPLEKK
jgi:hypothetical protein